MPSDTETPKWKRFEELIAKIQNDLAGDAVVRHNDRIMGARSGVLRQIDVSIRSRVGQFDLLIVMDCKDHQRPLDVKDVEDFIGLAQDVAAHKAAMVAVNGYSEAAKRRAQDAGVNLYRPLDTGDHDWKALVEIPTVIEFVGPTKFSLSSQGSMAKRSCRLTTQTCGSLFCTTRMSIPSVASAT